MARFLEEGKKAGTYAGTPMFMAPEIFIEEPYTNTVDIFSLGVILYKCIYANKLPFEEIFTSTATIQALFHNKNDNSKMPDLDGISNLELKDLLFKCLKVNPNGRLDISQVKAHPFVAINDEASQDLIIPMLKDESIHVCDATSSLKSASLFLASGKIGRKRK